MTELPADLPATVRAELTRLRAERVVHIAERERLLDQLRDADKNLRAALDQQRRLAADASLTEETRRRADEADALRTDITAVRRQRDELRLVLTETRRERDRMRLRLLDAELLLDSAGAPASPDIDLRMHAALSKAAELERELAATRATVSWRLTAPLRAVRRLVPPR